MRKRSVSSSMKTRETKLQEVTQVLSKFDELENDLDFVAETLLDIDNRLSTIQETYC